MSDSPNDPNKGIVDFLKPKEDLQGPSTPGYNPEGVELQIYTEFNRRKTELLNSRNNISGLNIDQRMREWDRNYFNPAADIPPSELDPGQVPVAINEAFSKVQTALGLLIDNDINFFLDEASPMYTANRELMRQLAKSSWRQTNSQEQLKLSVYNMAKRGWFCGRTFNKVVKANVKFLTELDAKGKTKYEEKTVTHLDDIAYVNLDNYNVWLDEETRPGDYFSTRDWMWREVWHIDKVRAMFPKEEYPNMEYVDAGGNTSDTIDSPQQPNQGVDVNTPRQMKEGMTEIYFYENWTTDRFIVVIHDVMVVYEPLPQNHKRLSCVYGYWNLRDALNIYGIGIVEEMERDEQLINRIMNMSMRQMLWSISPAGFYNGPEDPEDIKRMRPGFFQRMLDPKSVSWLTIPPAPPNWTDTIDWIGKKSDNRTGITESLEGEVQGTGKDTAFEVGLSKEAGLKRLKLPLRTLQWALNWELRNRIDLIKQTYSDFQVEHIADPKAILQYMEEVGGDPSFYFIENEGVPGQEVFYAKKYKQMGLNLQQDKEGMFQEASEKKFFHIKPEMLAYEGDVTVDVNSLLVVSQELEKQDTLRLASLISPLIQQDPNIFGPIVKQVLLAYNKSPRQWLPQNWVNFLEGKTEMNPGLQNTPVPGKPQTPLAPPGSPSPLDKPAIVSGENTVDTDQRRSLAGRLGAAYTAFKAP